MTTSSHSYINKARDRFERRIRKTDTCWFMDSAVVKSGYTRFSYDNVSHYGHRVSYKLYKDPDFQLAGTGNKENVIRHSCDNRGCINPDHLSIGTAKDNTKDMIVRERSKLFYNKGVLDTLMLPSDEMLRSIFYPTLTEQEYKIQKPQVKLDPYFTFVANKEFEKAKQPSWYQGFCVKGQNMV